MAGRKRNPRVEALRQLRAMLRDVLRPMLTYWDQPQSTHDRAMGWRKLRSVEQRENSAANWVQLESYMRLLARKATTLADFASERAREVQNRQ